MEILAHELKKGDEIIISRFSDVIYLKILSDARVNKDGSIKSFKCSYRADEMSYGKFTRDVMRCTPEGHNRTRWYNLNGRLLWLVKRDGEFVNDEYIIRNNLQTI